MFRQKNVLQTIEEDIHSQLSSLKVIDCSCYTHWHVYTFVWNVKPKKITLLNVLPDNEKLQLTYHKDIAKWVCS